MTRDQKFTSFFLPLFLLNSITACNPPCLYFSTGTSIDAIELQTGTVTTVVSSGNAGRPIAVAVHVRDESVYWSDLHLKAIKRIDLRSGQIDNVTAVDECEGIAIDWVNNYIYWTDSKKKRIEMMRLNGSDGKVLFNRDLDNIRGIAVDPVHGFMFWTDWGSRARIERATMSGQGRTTIIDSTIIPSVQYPNDVIVDYAESKIYWVDAGDGVVGRADLSGNNHERFVGLPKTNEHFAIALHINTIFLSNRKTKSIDKVDKLSGQDRGSYSKLSSLDQVMGIAVFDKSRQPQGSPACSRDNGGCTHLCFIAPQGKQCGCPNRYALRGDGRTCQEANFSNCFYRPCQNGGTCYFNFDKVSDDCLCTEYFIGEGCGLYIGNSSITVTLRMKLDEWDENIFQKGIAKGIYDYCIDDTCTNNLRIRQKLSCQSLSRNSSLTHINVTLIGKPITSLDTIQVKFAVLVSFTEDMKPTPIANTTLLTIIQEKAKLVSQQLGDVEIIYVNGERPSSESDCTKVQTGELPSGEKGKFPGAAVGGIVVVLCLAAVVICGVLCYRRKLQARDNQNQNGNEGRHYDEIPDLPHIIRNDLEGNGLRQEAEIPIPQDDFRPNPRRISSNENENGNEERPNDEIPDSPQNIRNDLEGIGLRQEAENPIPQDDFRPNPRRISSNEDGYAGLDLPRDGSYASLKNRADGASLPAQERRYAQLKPRSSAEHSNERAACNQGFERESVREPEENSCGPDGCEGMSSHHAVLCTEKP